MDPHSESRADHRAAEVCVALHQTGLRGRRDAKLEDFTPRYLTPTQRAKLTSAQESHGWKAMAAAANALRAEQRKGTKKRKGK